MKTASRISMFLLLAGLVMSACGSTTAEGQIVDAPATETVTTRDTNGGYAIVDTGQSACYADRGTAIACPEAGDAFFGQDAQIDGNQPSYTLSDDTLTVYDNVTGLTWTQSPDWTGDGEINVEDQMLFADAMAYPATLNAAKFGGYDDWRVPTIKELYSLINFNGTDPSGPNPVNPVPFIDTDYFDFAYGDTDAGERIIDVQYWSSNEYVGTVFNGQPAAFGLNLADGRIKGYPSASNGPVVATQYALYVRGNTAYGINNFVDNGDNTITDNATGLMWSQDDSGAGLTWQGAMEWVEARNAENYLGYNDWRLPNAKEMQSLVDYDRAPSVTDSAAIDPIFNITEITNEGGQSDYPWFWTGTTHLRYDGEAQAAVYITFGRALGYANNQWLDVHGAGAQRSDRKYDDFTGYTYAPDGYYFSLSPQGDTIRIFNFVRLVRDADAEVTVPEDHQSYLPLVVN